jgi:hypothetical protein
MSHLVDRAVYRLAGLWWKVIYSALCRPAKGATTLALRAFVPPAPARIERETVAA